MTEVDFWFVSGAATLSAAIIGWVCFLEVRYRLERQRRRAASIGFAGLKTAKAVREIVPRPRTTAAFSREQLRIACPDPKGEAKIAHAFAQVASLKACEAERTQTPLPFCA